MLSNAIGVPRTRDNSAFDLRNDEVGIEIKTLVGGKNEKITMSKTALARKLAEQQAEGLKAYTVVVDRRARGMEGKATYYYREGLGSFRLSSMKELQQVISKAPKEIASTAKALLDLAKGQYFLVITNGGA